MDEKQKCEGAENREWPGGVKSISSAVVVVARIQVLVIARTSGFTLSVRSLSAVMCKGVSIERVLRVHNKRLDEGFGPGFKCRSLASGRVERCKRESGLSGERKDVYLGRSTEHSGR